MSAALTPRYGFEVELLAPPGASRRDLADALARTCGGSYRPTFHHDAEPSLVENRPVFRHLSLGFDVTTGRGAPLARLVDDVTIVADLDATRPAEDGWHRVISDDARLLRLVEGLCDPGADPDELLVPLAAAFGVAPATTASGRPAVHDRSGATVAMVVDQPGERERVCEVVTPPLDSRGYVERLDVLLRTAVDLGFTVPTEAAVHLHLDAEPYRCASRLGPLVRTMSQTRDSIRAELGTNPHCRRLGPLPDHLVERCTEPGFDDTPWPEVQALLAHVPLTKYCDLNLVNLRDRLSGKDTVEVRILPGSIDAGTIATHVDAIERRLEPVRT